MIVSGNRISIIEARNCIDKFIDEALDLQEKIFRGAISHLTDFSNSLEQILTLKNKVSNQFFS